MAVDFVYDNRLESLKLKCNSQFLIKIYDEVTVVTRSTHDI